MENEYKYLKDGRKVDGIRTSEEALVNYMMQV